MHFSKMVIDLYRVRNAGMAWKRVKRNTRESERLLQDALQAQKNLDTLCVGPRRVRWIGREFQSADFFGIDEKWNLVFVETKVSSQQAHLAHQLHERVGRFVGMDFRHVDALIWKYVRGKRGDECLMADGLRLRRLAGKGRLERPQEVATRLKHWIHLRRPSKVRRVRFVAVSPHLNQTFARQLRQMQINLNRRMGRRGFVSFACVLLTPYLKNQAIAVARIHF